MASALPSACPGARRIVRIKITEAGLINRLIGAVTLPGDLVVDPCAGSFVVLQECRRLGRKFVGCDIAYDSLTDVA
jgi:DNA modification methylase